MVEHDRALSALLAIDPASKREDWVRAAMAAKAAGLPFEDFLGWSRHADNFKNEADCRAVWRSIDPSGPISAGTLFRMARDAGWKEPIRLNVRQAIQQALHRPSPPISAPATANGPLSQPAPATVLEFWDRCVDADASHPYIISKRGSPSGLRVVPHDDARQVAGEAVAGWLVIPAITLDGEMRTLQLVPPSGVGRKLNLPGSSFDESLFVVGTLASTERIFVVEGIGQAWACHAATGCAAVVTFGTARTERVCQALRARFPAAAVVVVPDRGKEAQAADIARKVSGRWVEMPESAPDNYDANDFASEHGGEALASLLQQLKGPPTRYAMLHGRDLLEIPPLSWMVRGILPSRGIAAIYGASGTGKSFLTLDLCAAVAAGREWFARRVTPCPVVYVALEGEAGFSQRIRAWRAHSKCEVPDPLRFVMQPFDLQDEHDLEDLTEAVRLSGCSGGLLVIDTLNRAAGGADENSSADMGRIISAVKRLQAEFGGLVLLVHHSGKDQSKGLRGHSSLHAALDAAIEVSRSDNRRFWRIAKSKDDADGAEHYFKLVVREVGSHDDGEPITSCAVVPEGGYRQAVRIIPPKSGNQLAALEALKKLARSQAWDRPADAPASAPRDAALIPVAVALGAIRSRLICDDKRRTERAQTALTGLQHRGIIRIEGEHCWLT
jgi:putative DNA primase/helicase